MFFKIHHIFILILCIDCLLSLKPTDLCLLKQLECSGYYNSFDKYKVKCELISCRGNYSVKCGTQKCASTQQDCDSYSFFSETTNMYKYKSDINKYALLSTQASAKTKQLVERKKLKYFNQNIPECPHENYQFNVDDVCSNGLNCYEKYKTFKASGMQFGMKKVTCMCPNAYNYHCGNKFCTLNKSVCDYLDKNKLNMTKLAKIKECGNKNTTYFRIFSSIFN